MSTHPRVASRALRVSFCCADTDAVPWLEDLRRALPDMDISLWRPGAAPADYGIVWAPPQQYFDEQPQLRAVFNIGAGVDALLRLNIPQATVLVRLDDAGMAGQMAEYVCHALLRHFRDMAAYAEAQRAGVWEQRQEWRNADYPVGILGLGTLGEHVAQAVRAFDFPVVGWSRTAKNVAGVRGFHGADQLQDFLRATRVLVCVLPLTPQTRDLLNLERLSLLQPGGYVINVARGALIVDEDLLALIDAGHLAGAALDVFRTEPLPADHAFWKHPRIAITPHIAARTLRDVSIAQITAKLLAMEAGQNPAGLAGVVDRTRGY